MDDIYTDLDNYNDVNIVEELKNENKELKFKLEEYSSAMHQLQKDFDKLSVEYKNLEKNYSSLLKTARAEIERKTQTIKNLNLEKDTLVLNSLQKGKNILHNRRIFKDTQQNRKSTEDTCLKEVKKIIKDSAEHSDNKLYNNRQPSIDTVSSIPTSCESTRNENKISKTEFENKTSKESHVRSRDGRDKIHIKDNVPEELSVRKLMSRRKSIPNFGHCEPQFSSDDDSRKTNLEPQQRNIPLAGEDMRHFERHYEQQDYMQPESFDHYQPPPPNRNRGNRHCDLERQRNYESYDKSGRNYSSDSHRYGRELSENYNQRDYTDNKRRFERSPPNERYNRSKSRDRRYNFERENYRDYGRHSYHNNDHFPAKNKSKFELEEPTSKRPKVDSYSRHTTEHNFKYEKERELSERYTSTKSQEPFQSSSCQSPDYINIDSNAIHHSVKEIRHTSLTPLPDPRLLSNKYILTSNSKKPILATVAGCNIDIIPISNPTWGEDKQESLVKSYPKEVDFVPEIYRDVENSGKSPSLESGEIHSLDEDHYATSSNIDKKEDNANSSVNKILQNISHFAASKEAEKTLINKYKIPHLKRHSVTKESSITQEQQDVSKKLHAFVKDFKVVVEGKHLSEKCSENDSKNIDNVDPIDNEKQESVLQRLMNEQKLSKKSEPTKFRRSDKIVNISTIEGDLELSDETSDNMDLLKEDSTQNIHKVEKTDHLIKNEHTSSDKLKDRDSKTDDKVKKSRESRKSSRKKEHGKEKTRDSSKRRKYKKSADQEELIVAKEVSPQTKRNKEKENKPSSSSQKKNKFTDLFGDSNSLITPDDLGISNVMPDKYVSAFENTQDAVDLNVEDITMVKTRKSADNANIEQINQQISHDTNNITNDENPNSNECNENDKSDKSTNLYENTNSETDTSNVVKTVIISTGIQPQNILQDMYEAPPNIKESDLKKNVINTVKAIATSTPYKVTNPIDSQTTINSTITDNSGNTKDNTDDSDLNIVNNLKTNSEDKCEPDIPDVRIFVRRRKKATKKPT